MIELVACGKKCVCYAGDQRANGSVFMSLVITIDTLGARARWIDILLYSLEKAADVERQANRRHTSRMTSHVRSLLFPLPALGLRLVANSASAWPEIS